MGYLYLCDAMIWQLDTVHFKLMQKTISVMLQQLKQITGKQREAAVSLSFSGLTPGAQVSEQHLLARHSMSSEERNDFYTE